MPNNLELGPDLPKTEQQLFALQQFPILDIHVGLKHIGDEIILNDLLRLLLTAAIPDDLLLIEDAYKQQNWQKIEDLAHKMKSGALYCGATRMQYACQYLERYRKAGHTKCLDKLYKQLIQTLHETLTYLSLRLR